MARLVPAGLARASVTAALVAAAIASVAGASACSIDSATHLVYNAADDQEPLTTTTTTAACSSAFAAPDLSTLTTCGTNGHCYDSDKFTAFGTLPTCPTAGQVCVPDTILEADGKPLVSCNSVIDKPGACVSTMIAEIEKNASQLTQDVCATGERCIPCVNPLDGTNTPFCQPIGVHADTCGGDGGATTTTTTTAAATTPQLCCPTEAAPPQGVCLSGDDIPSGQRGKVSQNVCPPDYSCVPSAFVSGSPVACSSSEGDGFCMDECFTGDLGSRALLQGSCPGPRDKCVPCLVGKGEGLPGCN